MKALTVKNPWAWAIIHGGKDVENRSRSTQHRGRLYIHAGKGWSHEGQKFLQHKRSRFGFLEFGLDQWQRPELAGKVIGTVDLVDCHHVDQCSTHNDKGRRAYCSDWAMSDHYHWVLANPQEIEPFAATGKLGLWNLEGPR